MQFSHALEHCQRALGVDVKIVNAACPAQGQPVQHDAAQEMIAISHEAYRKEEGVLGAASLQVEVIHGLPVVL